MSRSIKPEPPPGERTCDCCGRKKPLSEIRDVRVRAQGKATVYLSGTAKWCADCRRDKNGTWKYQ